MPWRGEADRAGIIVPEHVALLGRVFDATSLAGETDREREARASRIIAYFQSGITDEKELRTLAKQALGR